MANQKLVKIAEQLQQIANEPDRYEKIEPTLIQILKCAREHSDESVHLQTIASILKEWLE